jgi:choline dehydrogenase-like flavoprotein
MITDGRKLKPGASLDYDICIVGSGPAGITLALELANSKKRVCVLEAGGYKASKTEINEFLSGDNVGLPYKLLDSRSRQFGGTSDKWAGYLAIMSPVDFKQNPKIPHSGWPISFDDLLPYYGRAFKTLGGSNFEFDPARFERPQYERIPFKFDEVISKLWHFSLINFGKKFEKFLKQSKSIDVYLNATVARINLNTAANRVSHLTVATSAKTAFTVKTKVVILACGGMENARVLLAQDRKTRAAYDNNNIGRYFMDHPHYNECANLILVTRHADTKLYKTPDRAMRSGTKSVCAYLQIGDEIREKLGLPNTSFGMKRPAVSFKQHTRISLILKGLYGRAENTETHYQINANLEQIPNPSSRVSISEKMNMFGMPKIRLDWQLTEDDIKRAAQSVRLFALKLGENGLGRLQIEEWFANGKLDGRVDYGFHHLGTTRMAHTPLDGVVDTNCKIFGVDNLFIAGSSVFPSSSCRNPTFTIMALVIRLADYLKTM